MKVGAVTIGQTPRTDVMPDILPILGAEVEVIQTGALDGLTKEEIAAMGPKENDYVLVSRLKDGTFAKFGESFILERLKKCVKQLSDEGVSLIMWLCGGVFPDIFETDSPIVYPAKLLNGLALALSKNSNIIVITPDEEQVQQAYDQWGALVKKVTSISANPYGEMDEVVKAAEMAKESDADLIVMDCIGYSRKAKHIVASVSGKRVLLCRTVLARVVNEMLDV